MFYISTGQVHNVTAEQSSGVGDACSQFHTLGISWVLGFAGFCNFLSRIFIFLSYIFLCFAFNIKSVFLGCRVSSK